MEERSYNIGYIIIREGGNFIKSDKYRYFVNNGEFFFEGQILNYYDYQNNYIGQVLLYKFIKHYHRIDKTPYICVSIKFLNGNKNDFQTFDAEEFLGNIFTTKFKNVENCY